MIDLGTLGGSYIYSYEITENGQVLGHGQTATGYDHAFLWQNGVLMDLATLGGNDSYPYAINESGQVIGVSKTISGEDHATLCFEINFIKEISQVAFSNLG